MPNVTLMAAWKAAVILILALTAFGAESANAAPYGWRLDPSGSVVLAKGERLRLPCNVSDVDARPNSRREFRLSQNRRFWEDGSTAQDFTSTAGRYHLRWFDNGVIVNLSGKKALVAYWCD